MATFSIDWFGFRQGLQARLRSLILVRAAVGTALLGTTTILSLRVEAPLDWSPFVFIAVLYFLTIIYSVLLDRVSNLPLLAAAQIFGDLLLISGFLVASGGVNSPFSVLYAVSIVSGSILLYKPGGYLTAAFSCLLLGTLSTLENLHILPRSPILPFDRRTLELSIQLSQLFLDFFGFFLIGHLSGHLAERLRRSSEMLEAREQNLLELKHFNHHVLQSISSGVLTTGKSGLITSANPAALDLCGFEFGSLAGRSIFEVFPMLSREFFFETRRGRQAVELAREWNGKRRILEISVDPFQALSGEIEGYIVVLRDITELRRLENMEKESDKLAALGEMASTIAHEIRNPLASMRGSVELLSKELHLSGTNQRLMEIVLRESDRLNKLVTDFLSYARQRPPRLELQDLSRLLQDVALLLENDVACENVEISMELHALEIPLWLDAEQFRQVLWNLAHNGVRAMGGRGTLHIGSREVILQETTKQEGVCVFVRDTGCGMGPQELGKLFQPFRSRKNWGAGLGLAIVKRIVTGHHGEIEVESKPGGGTTVLVYLPAPSTQDMESWRNPVGAVA